MPIEITKAKFEKFHNSDIKNKYTCIMFIIKFIDFSQFSLLKQVSIC